MDVKQKLQSVVESFEQSVFNAELKEDKKSDTGWSVEITHPDDNVKVADIWVYQEELICDELRNMKQYVGSCKDFPVEFYEVV